MNLYAITACYGNDRDTALVLAADDAAAEALAGQGHDPRGLGTTGTEVWLVASDCKQVGTLPATPSQAAWLTPEALQAPETGGPTAAELLRRATGPGPASS